MMEVPVFFRQKRCTIGGKVFEIHKFRSMIVDAEKEGEVIPAKEDDERITPVGKFIRKTRIDELPQFIDILKGDMSVVGSSSGEGGACRAVYGGSAGIFLSD